MKRWRLIFFAVFIMLLSIVPISNVYASGVPQEVLDASNSVVYIEDDTTNGILSGSGFIIKNGSDGTFIATNNHVISTNPEGVSVWTGENEKRSATVIASSDEYDLAVIKLSEPIETKALTLSADASQGDEVFAVGYPGAANSLSDTEAHVSNQATITNGIISSIKTMKNVDYGPSVKLLQINAEINSGNSGGPLLNDKGQVVGINTYGVMNAQGIFGAISASELITFIENNQVYGITTEGTNNFGWVLPACIGLIIVLAVILAIILIPRIKTKKRLKKELSLNDYLSRLASGIDAYSTVSLMMPIILYLRNKHNEGSVFLKLSPSRISVTKDGCKLRDSADNPTDEFVAPEQSTGGAFAGIRADIYGVCAILRYILNFHKVITDEEQPIGDSSSEGLTKIINKGLSKNPDERFANMQELILELSPFNTGIGEKALAPFEAFSEPVNKLDTDQDKTSIGVDEKKLGRKKLTIILSIVGATLIIFVLLGYSAINYVTAISNATNYDFKDAEVNINNVPFSEDIFPQDDKFIEAGTDMQNRNYDGAITILESMSNYKGVPDLLSEAKYRKAAMLADENSYDGAINIYKEISGYKDSADLINDTIFRKACYDISKGDYQTALDILNSMTGYTAAGTKIQELYYVWGCDLAKNGGYVNAYNKLLLDNNYEDTADILNSLKVTIYNDAVQDYHSALYDKAQNEFTVLSNYKDSESYLILIDAHLNISDFYFDSSKLWPLIGFEDAAELITSDDLVSQDFLLGKWEKGSWYFTMKDSGSITYNIPWFKYGDCYEIKNGKVLLLKTATPNITKTLFEITIINQNCIKILSYKNYKTYTLYRQ